MMVPPGRSWPVRSASSIMVRPIRSLTLPPGFSSSSLARIVGLMPAVTLCSRTSGVFPTRSRMLSENFNAPSSASLSLVGAVLGAEPAEEDDGRGDAEGHLAEDHEHGAGDRLV